MRIAPCRDCCSRCLGCHDICDLYKSYRANKDRIQNEIVSGELDYGSYITKAIHRMKGER